MDNLTPYFFLHLAHDESSWLVSWRRLSSAVTYSGKWRSAYATLVKRVETYILKYFPHNVDYEWTYEVSKWCVTNSSLQEDTGLEHWLNKTHRLLVPATKTCIDYLILHFSFSFNQLDNLRENKDYLDLKPVLTLL